MKFSKYSVSYKNNKRESRNKLINIKYLAIWEDIKSNKVVVEYINSKFMIIDPLIKSL